MQNSTGTVKHCIVFRRSNTGVVILLDIDGNIKSYVVNGGNIIDAKSHDFNIVSHKMQPINDSFEVRDAFVARKSGHVITFASYVRFTSDIQPGFFADTGFPNAYGVLALVAISSKLSYVCYCQEGKLSPENTVPAGFYSVVGAVLG